MLQGLRCFRSPVEVANPVAGLDLSLRSTGVAILTPGAAFVGTVGIDLDKDASDRDRIWRNIMLCNHIIGELKAYHVKWVALENYSFDSVGVARLADLGGLVKANIMIALGTPPSLIPPSTLRKYHLGKETKDKKVLARYLEGLGFPKFQKNDESDAMALALIMNDYRRAPSSLSDYQVSVHDKIAYHLGARRKAPA